MTLYTAIEHVDVQISDAQLLDLVANPIVLVPAPGVGLMIDVLGAVVVLDLSAGAYVVTDDAPPNLAVGGSSSPLVVEFDGDPEAVISGFLTSLVEPIYPEENGPLHFVNTGTDLTGGGAGNTLSLRVYFRIEPAVPFGKQQ